MAPLDHTFRFYEPENSHFEILVPPFIDLNQIGLTAMVSDPQAKVEMVPTTSIFRVTGMSGETLTR